MTNSALPDLTFPLIAYSDGETPWDLYPLLFKGGAASHIRIVLERISSGLLGPLLKERLPLIKILHDTLMGDLVGGASRHSIHTRIRILRRFYSWIDTQSTTPTSLTIEDLYVEWTEFLLERQRSDNALANTTVYVEANHIAVLLSKALDLTSSPQHRTRIKRNSVGRERIAHQSQKQNLQDTFTFGHVLLDICNSLTVEAVWGKLPIRLDFRAKKSLEEWSGLMPPESLKRHDGSRKNSYDTRISEKKRQAWEADKSFRTRHSVVNLRIEAELLLFIAQTGMNLAQAYKLKMGKYSYQSYVHGYEVRRVFKNRRKGEVEFCIYSEYRPLFEKFLTWRNSIFSAENTDLLFPFITPQGRSQDIAPLFSGLKKKCRQLDILYIGPRLLRLTRANWLMRHTRDVALVSEMNQHSQDTLLRSYDKPHHQVAMIEISRFFGQTDISLISPSPGVCNAAKPEAISELVENFPQPDCVSPAGCFFCTHYRDIDSADHVWSLASYRYLKSLELSKYRPAEKERPSHPAMAVIRRISEKLLFISKSNVIRQEWVAEANARVNEGHHHPKWDGFIQLIEVN